MQNLDLSPRRNERFGSCSGCSFYRSAFGFARRRDASGKRRGRQERPSSGEPDGRDQRTRYFLLERRRALLRDRSARDAEGLFVCEGPRVIEAALDASVPLVECFVAAGADERVHDLARRAGAGGAAVYALDRRVGDTVTPQPILATVPLARSGTDALAGVDLAVVAVELADPGNAGVLVRSAAAAGA